MLRPWNAGEVGTCDEDQYTRGCTAWRRRLASPRIDIDIDSALSVKDTPALTLAQKRKLSNLFAEVTQKRSSTTRLMREADVVQVCAAAHLAAAGVAYDDSHELVKAARAWYAFFEKAAGVVEHGEGISLVQFWHAATVMLSKADSELPDAVVALPVLQFKLAAGTTAQLSKPQFVAWRLATGRLTPAQLSQVTRIDGIGGHEPSLDDVFSAADNGRKKALSVEDWERLVVRFWCCSEPWDELNAYSL